MKVCIDPGHGGYDPGAVGPTGLREKDVALQIALKAGKLLQSEGVEIAYTRTSDAVPWPANVNQDLAVRSQITNQTGADLFISVHLNSGSSTAHGTETYCLQFGGQGEQAARLVQSNLTSVLGLTDRGVKAANYYVLRKTSMPAILTEVCFISNPTEENLARTAAFITQAAQAIASGICKYFGVREVNPVDNVSEWAKEAWKWAIEKGICADDNPKDTLTKEQVVFMIYKAFGGK